MAASGEPCIPCQRTGLSDREYEVVLKNYLENMDEDMKTPEPAYRERMSSCSRCEFLRNGICRLCGCFAALRAAKTHNRCADTPSRW